MLGFIRNSFCSAFAGILFVFVLVSCEKTNYSVSIINNSTKTVSYTYNGISDTLASAETKLYEVKAYTQAPKNIADQDGIASISMRTEEDLFTFTDATSYKLSARNELPVDITIKANNYIEKDGSVELSIKTETEETAIIYTKSPAFTTTSNYPAIFEWKFKNNEISLTIK